MKRSATLKGVCVGVGHFSQFHYEAWTRISEVSIVAVCDTQSEVAEKTSRKFHIPRYYQEVEQMIIEERPDFIDIITPPPTHYDICKIAANHSVHIICQKPLAPTLEEAEAIATLIKKSNIRMMVHENFRFQPWFREVKNMLREGVIGDKIQYLNFRLRTGDGWQKDAYMDRQPYFRTMERLFMYETGIHYIDTFRYLIGDIKRVYAKLKKFNPDIKGEDFSLVHFDFENGATALLDANRYNENTSEDPRLTFGEMLVDTNGGSIRLHHDGTITQQRLGQKEEQHMYTFRKVNFSGDCVYATQKHFVDALLNNTDFETGLDFYLENIKILEAVYKSDEIKRPIGVVKKM